MKKILVVHYSQTGQLTRLVDSVIQPVCHSSEIDVTHLQIELNQPYPFPWPFMRFFDEIPTCNLEQTPVLDTTDWPDSADFDLVLLAYQVWYLSPSPPMTAFLKTNEATQVLKGCPVITLIGCRNMWVMAHEIMKKKLKALGADYLGNIAVVDQGNAFASVITTPRWMFTGRKGRFLKIFPPAGIAQDVIDASSRFGVLIRDALLDGRIARRVPILKGENRAYINPRLLLAERTGKRVFLFWSRLFNAAGPSGSIGRKTVVSLFLVFFIPLLIVMIPVRMCLLFVLWPLLKKRLTKEAATYRD